ncbi:hypothetical protein EDD16DRAFT_1526616 [Pisolithus croceorrhizus]|nr:hypothetical protein EDD16DRAFT_1526616 [Pisolithus croceorrhizus]KAI6117517.1 hypothetical protein EV401DRAFT_1888950 [Pisolithus croceorrhizus]KAI6167530.1 hypothetical protein EDD17DRAFT_1504062 [Pisolithus thermaeus]
MLYYRDYKSYESQLKHENPVQRSSSSFKGQLIVEQLRSTPWPLKGMPRKGAVDAPRFSGSPDDLLSCFEDCEWAQWSIWYLGIKKFKQWRRSPPAQYLKYDLYDLVDEQKKVKINFQKPYLTTGYVLPRLQHTFESPTNFQASRRMTYTSKGLIESFKVKFLEALSGMVECGMQKRAQEAQYEARLQESRALRAQEWCREMEKSDSSKLSKVPGGSLRGQALKVEVAVAELSCSPLVEGQCKSSFKCIQVNSYIPGQPLTAELQGEHLQAKWEEQNKEELLGTKPSVELKATEAMGNIPEPQSKYLHSSSSPHTDNLPQNPLNEPQEALDETRTVKRPVEPAVHALEVLKPPLEPKDDLHEAPEQAGSCKVEEVKQKIEAEM